MKGSQKGKKKGGLGEIRTHDLDGLEASLSTHRGALDGS